jgi:hypothetical protein
MKLRRLVALFFLAVSSLAQAATATRTEIDNLLARLQASGCQFNRNGSWYTGSEARDHLLRKLDYLEGKGSIQNTEQFIQLAASSSSSSGKAYLVRCGNDAAVPSQQWLTRELAILRQRP